MPLNEEPAYCATLKQEPKVPLSSQELKKLKRVISLLVKLVETSPKPRRGRPPLKKSAAGQTGSSGKRIRRTGRALIVFRKMLKAERKKGLPVAELARKHGISSAYVYQIR